MIDLIQDNGDEVEVALSASDHEGKDLAVP